MILLTLQAPTPQKWSKTLKQFVEKLPTNCLSVFDHFVGLTHKGLKSECKILTSIQNANNVTFKKTEL